MKSKNIVHVISCHAEGEVGDVIVGGVAVPPGNTLWEQRNFIHKELTQKVVNTEVRASYMQAYTRGHPYSPDVRHSWGYRSRGIPILSKYV